MKMMMPNNQLNDAMAMALRKELYTGTLDEMVSAWLKAEGATGSHLMGLWQSYWNIKAVPAGHHNYRERTWLGSLGYTQVPLADRKLSYWRARAIAP